MANNPSQKLLILTVNPDTTQDLVPVLEKFPWWGDGWQIQQVSLTPHGDNQVFVAVVLNKERQGSRDLPPPALG
jgi:hypothetical protein